MSVSRSDLISLRKDFLLSCGFFSLVLGLFLYCFCLFVCSGASFLFFLCLSVKHYKEGYIGFMGDESGPGEPSWFFLVLLKGPS